MLPRPLVQVSSLFQRNNTHSHHHTHQNQEYSQRIPDFYVFQCSSCGLQFMHGQYHNASQPLNRLRKIDHINCSTIRGKEEGLQVICRGCDNVLGWYTQAQSIVLRQEAIKRIGCHDSNPVKQRPQQLMKNSWGGISSNKIQQAILRIAYLNVQRTRYITDGLEKMCQNYSQNMRMVQTINSMVMQMQPRNDDMQQGKIRKSQGNQLRRSKQHK